MEPVEADGVIPCGHISHQYSAGTNLILTKKAIWHQWKGVVEDNSNHYVAA